MEVQFDFNAGKKQANYIAWLGEIIELEDGLNIVSDEERMSDEFYPEPYYTVSQYFFDNITYKELDSYIKAWVAKNPEYRRYKVAIVTNSNVEDIDSIDPYEDLVILEDSLPNRPGSSYFEYTGNI